MILKISTFRPTPETTLRQAIGRGGWRSMITSSRRWKDWQGRPGEVIERMPEEQRAMLRELRSDDISEGRIGNGVAWLSWDGSSSRTDPQGIFEEFDRKMLRIPEPVRHLRRVRLNREPLY